MSMVISSFEGASPAWWPSLRVTFQSPLVRWRSAPPLGGLERMAFHEGVFEGVDGRKASVSGRLLADVQGGGAARLALGSGVDDMRSKTFSLSSGFEDM